MQFSETCMKFESVVLSKISLNEKDRYQMISLNCGIKKDREVAVLNNEKYLAF